MTLLATDPDSTQTGAERLLAAARELRPLLREHAAQIEADRRIPDHVAKKLNDAGMWRMRRPEEFGGFGINLRQTVDICGELAKGCPSTAYMTAMLNGNDIFHLLYPRETQEEFYADRDARSCVLFASSPKARRVEGGWNISGKWGYATGSLNATWADVAFERMDENGVSQGTSFALVPLSEARIEDTWQVVSLVGTGSFSVVLEDVFVPDARTVDYGSILELVPSFGISASLSVCVSIVGMADGMLEAVVEKLGKHQPIAYTAYRRAIDSPSVQLNIADAAQLIDGARLHLYRAADDFDSAVAEGRELDLVQRARIRADVGSTANLIRKAAELLLNVGGPSAFAISSAIQRQWRDLELGSRHGYINYDIAREAYGKALLGLDVADVTSTV